MSPRPDIRHGPHHRSAAVVGVSVHAHHAGHQTPLDGVLHALGPDRIRHLVQPRTGPAGLPAAFMTTSYLAMLVLMATIVYMPYLGAALYGRP